MGDRILSISTIDLETAERRVMGDLDFLKEMLGEFCASIPSFLETIRMALGNRDFALLSKTAHQLKGAALNLSANRIAARADLLNESGRQADYEKAEAVMQGLTTDVADFEAYLHKRMWRGGRF
jgi:HPt (histidine-containing phosphotransfer) domain-containing protein